MKYKANLQANGKSTTDFYRKSRLLEMLKIGVHIIIIIGKEVYFCNDKKTLNVNLKKYEHYIKSLFNNNSSGNE